MLKLRNITSKGGHIVRLFMIVTMLMSVMALSASGTTMDFESMSVLEGDAVPSLVVGAVTVSFSNAIRVDAGSPVFGFGSPGGTDLGIGGQSPFDNGTNTCISDGLGGLPSDMNRHGLSARWRTLVECLCSQAAANSNYAGPESPLLWAFPGPPLPDRRLRRSSLSWREL